MGNEELKLFANEQKRSEGLQREGGGENERKTNPPVKECPRIEYTDSISFDSSSGSFQLVISQ